MNAGNIVFRVNLKKKKWFMRQIKILTYSWDLALSKMYLEVMTQCLGAKLFDHKVDVLFDFFYFIE